MIIGLTTIFFGAVDIARFDKAKPMHPKYPENDALDIDITRFNPILMFGNTREISAFSFIQDAAIETNLNDIFQEAEANFNLISSAKRPMPTRMPVISVRKLIQTP